MEETNSPSVAHVGYDISPLKRVKFKILTTSSLLHISTFTLIRTYVGAVEVVIVW